MIKMNAPFLDGSLEIFRGKINILALENRNLFAKTVFEVFRENSELRFFDTENYDEFREILLISDMFDFDTNSAKMIKLLYENIERKIFGEEVREKLVAKFYELQADLGEMLFSENDLELKNEKEFAIKDLLKFYGIKIDWSRAENFCENFYQILDVAAELLPSKMLIFANVLPYFSENDFAKIAEYVWQKNLRILLIESSRPKNREISSAVYELDEDMFFVKSIV